MIFINIYRLFRSKISPNISYIFLIHHLFHALTILEIIKCYFRWLVLQQNILYLILLGQLSNFEIFVLNKTNTNYWFQNIQRLIKIWKSSIHLISCHIFLISPFRVLAMLVIVICEVCLFDKDNRRLLYKPICFDHKNISNNDGSTCNNRKKCICS